MKSKISILLAEDEESLGMIVKESLETRNFEVDHVADGEKAWDQIQAGLQYDVFILDVMMPKLDGFALAEKIRKKGEKSPIIFLTSRSRAEDAIEGFKRGANDYVRKPFSMEELIVRINELIRRNQAVELKELAIGEYQFIPGRQVLKWKEEEITLTARESQLLAKLARQLNQEVDRNEILNELWGNDDFFNGRSMDVFITKLRKKLSNDPSVQIINVRGFGYKLIC